MLEKLVILAVLVLSHVVNTKRVAILGGGVGGLSAALELVDRGYQVDIYDRQEVFGGKARSIPFKGTGTDGRSDLPAEHGFRFFPGFYAHINDTFKRVPYQNSTVFKNFIDADFDMLARIDADPWVFPTHGPNSTMDLIKDLFLLLKIQKLHVPVLEQLYFAQRVSLMVMSCPARWESQYDAYSYWNYTSASKLSLAYQNYLVKGVTRNILAAKAELTSLKTIGRTFIRLLESAVESNFDRLLNGPTNEKWLTPMVEHLTKLGVSFYPLHTVKSFTLDGNKITNVIVKDGQGNMKTITADHYISGMPAERMAEFVTPEMAKVAPSMSRIKELRVDWMNGIMFYFKKPVPIVHGHVGYFDSPWALTSISQQQFWPDVNVSRLGDGSAVDILSVDVSSWNVAGLKDGPAKGKTAMQCSKEEIIQEVWFQLHRHLPKIIPLNMSDVVSNVFFDPDIHFTEDGRTVTADDEPLLINEVGTWEKRPKATTEIGNLYLAADYVQTETDVACMEAANEAGRRAVNGLLQNDQRTDFVKLYDLYWPKQFEWERQHDCTRFKNNQMPIGWNFPVPAFGNAAEIQKAMSEYVSEWEQAMSA